MAELLLKTAWVAPAYEAGGLDHLGVKAPIMHIYSELLPGITNVTDRLRYYSFYTWVVWSLDQRGERSADAFQRAIRRADCLFTLVAESHGLADREDKDAHSGATVGNSTLSAVARKLGDGGTVHLSTYASEEVSDTRYFKNRFGGLGQYYLGSLRDLFLLWGDGNSGINYTSERGGPVAKAFDSFVDGARFWNCIEADAVSADDLDALATFCPCQLANSGEEREALAQVLFALDGHAHQDRGPARRSTLQMMLQLVRSLDLQNASFDVRSFRRAVYGMAMPDGETWVLPSDLESIRDRWAAYVMNEVLSLGLQGLFFAILTARQSHQVHRPVESARDMAAWFFAEGPGRELAREFGERSLTEVLDAVSSKLPERAVWAAEAHELTLAFAITDERSTTEDDAGTTKVSSLAVDALLALAARLRDVADPYAGLTFPPGYFNHFPLNLRSYKQHLRGEWRDVTVTEWLHLVAADWCIGAHIRVALRKLRAQSTATFQIKPLDQGLWVVGAPEPQFSSPRFYQARRILADLGAIERVEGERYAVTDFGRRLMVATSG